MVLFRSDVEYYVNTGDWYAVINYYRMAINPKNEYIKSIFALNEDNSFVVIDL